MCCECSSQTSVKQSKLRAFYLLLASPALPVAEEMFKILFTYERFFLLNFKIS